MLLAELKHDLNAYLATLPATVRTRTLAQLIAFNRAHRAEEMPLFGQDLFEQARGDRRTRRGLSRRARATSLRLAGRGGDRPIAARAQCRRSGRPDPARRLADRRGPRRPVSPGGGRRAASPRSPAIRTSPCRWARCAGFRSASPSSAPKWSDARILALGYAYEQASHRPDRAALPAVDRGERRGRAAPPAAPALALRAAALRFFGRARRAVPGFDRASAAQRCIASASS